jgi:K+-sensing histidine kinase KdpD
MIDLLDKNETQFAPAARLTDEEILRQAAEIKKQSIVPDLFNIIPYILLVLNKQRQIIYSNHVLFDVLGVSPEKVVGFRPGEVLDCVHAGERPGGCGTTESCSVCGAVLAILEAQKNKTAVSRECLLTAHSDSGPKCFELAVYAVPAGMVSDEYTLFIVRDISEEKRKQVFEQIFFHDLLNTSGAVKGFVEIMQEAGDLNEVRELSGHANETVDILIDEINNQKELIAAENGKLTLNLSSFSAQSLISGLAAFYRKSDPTLAPIRLHCREDVVLTSDPVLVRRVVNNMLKNALEASEGDAVSLWVEKKENHVEFGVHNNQYIPREAQLQLFKRSYSSKGSGRGLGTYSMKLLGERYLGGSVSFQSAKDAGTTFVFSLPIRSEMDGIGNGENFPEN